MEREIAEADGTGGATGVAVPVAKWLGLALLQLLQNTKLTVDVKLDNHQKENK